MPQTCYTLAKHTDKWKSAERPTEAGLSAEYALLLKLNLGKPHDRCR